MLHNLQQVHRLALSALAVQRWHSSAAQCTVLGGSDGQCSAVCGLKLCTHVRCCAVLPLSEPATMHVIMVHTRLCAWHAPHYRSPSHQATYYKPMGAARRVCVTRELAAAGSRQQHTHTHTPLHSTAPSPVPPFYPPPTNTHIHTLSASHPSAATAAVAHARLCRPDCRRSHNLTLIIINPFIFFKRCIRFICIGC